MRVSKGGTDMYCPGCEEISTCQAVPAAQITFDSEDYCQRWSHGEHEDINWFQRGRICLNCEHEFITAEVDKVFLTELVELRDALADIKENAENYLTESSKAASSLKRLNASLKVLRALKL